MARYSYKTQGTCSKEIILDVEDGVIQNVTFVGGCPGNTKGVAFRFGDRDTQSARGHCRRRCLRHGG